MLRHLTAAFAPLIVSCCLFFQAAPGQAVTLTILFDTGLDLPEFDTSFFVLRPVSSTSTSSPITPKQKHKYTPAVQSALIGSANRPFRFRFRSRMFRNVAPLSVRAASRLQRTGRISEAEFRLFVAILEAKFGRQTTSRITQLEEQTEQQASTQIEIAPVPIPPSALLMVCAVGAVCAIKKPRRRSASRSD